MKACQTSHGPYRYTAGQWIRCYPGGLDPFAEEDIPDKQVGDQPDQPVFGRYLKQSVMGMGMRARPIPFPILIEHRLVVPDSYPEQPMVLDHVECGPPYPYSFKITLIRLKIHHADGPCPKARVKYKE